MNARISLLLALGPALLWSAEGGPPIATVLVAPETGQYVEPDFDGELFDVQALELSSERATRMASALVQVAYFLSDRPLASAKAVAVAHALVPRHSGALVANFRLRAGRGPEEATLIVPNDIALELLQGVALILDNNPEAVAGQPAACLLDVVSTLPVDDPDLVRALETLRAEVPPANWRSAFPTLAGTPTS